MKVERVMPSEIDINRLDADFYRFDFMENERRLKASGFNLVKLGAASGRIACGPFGSNLPSSLYRSSGIPLYRVQNVRHGVINEVGLVYLEKSVSDTLDSCLFHQGDLLIAKSGNLGRVANVPMNNGVCNVTQDVIGVSIADDFDSHYICSFFSSTFGSLEIIRNGQGNVQQHLNMPSVRTFLFPDIENLAQKYIGEKVRQAERLKSWAKELVNRADSTISSLFEFSLVPSMRSQPRSISSELLSPVSLGPEFARTSEGQATFADSMKLEDYIDSCKCGDPIKSEDRVDGKYSYYGASGPIDKHNDYNFDGEYLIVAQDGSIGCANIARGKFWANNHVWVVKLNAAYDIDSVCRYLDEHFPYWKGVTTGSVVPKVTSENLLNVQVPIAIAKNEYIGDLLRLSSNATSLSSTLVNIAKLLVEDLIEGQVSEAELVAVQKALNGGDESLDRALLERMTAEGIDGEGDPLFDDIDQLYDLLEQAKQALDAEVTMAEV